MEFNNFDFGVDRIYNTGKLTFDDFYEENSINDKFRDFLKEKYGDKVESYIKPFGTHNNVTSYAVELLDHNNTYRKYINQVHVNFNKVKNNECLYQLGMDCEGEIKYKVFGYKDSLSQTLFNDTIEFLDGYFTKQL